MRRNQTAAPADAGGPLRLALAAAAGCAVLMFDPPVPRAACTDLAAPGVEWRRCRMDGAALEGVDLTGARLADASFQRASLKGARLVEVDGRRIRLISTDLRGAVLDGADLTNGDLTSADLRDASLKGTNLRRARLFRADLRGADLTGANLDGADLLHAELAGARWIDGVSVCAEDSVGRCHPRPAPPADGAAGDPRAAAPAAAPSGTLGPSPALGQ